MGKKAAVHGGLTIEVCGQSAHSLSLSCRGRQYTLNIVKQTNIEHSTMSPQCRQDGQYIVHWISYIEHWTMSVQSLIEPATIHGCPPCPGQMLRSENLKTELEEEHNSPNYSLLPLKCFETAITLHHSSSMPLDHQNLLFNMMFYDWFMFYFVPCNF